MIFPYLLQPEEWHCIRCCISVLTLVSVSLPKKGDIKRYSLSMIPVVTVIAPAKFELNSTESTTRQARSLLILVPSDLLKKSPMKIKNVVLHDSLVKNS